MKSPNTKKSKFGCIKIKEKNQNIISLEMNLSKCPFSEDSIIIGLSSLTNEFKIYLEKQDNTFIVEIKSDKPKEEVISKIYNRILNIESYNRILEKNKEIIELIAYNITNPEYIKTQDFTLENQSSLEDEPKEFLKDGGIPDENVVGNEEIEDHEGIFQPLERKEEEEELKKIKPKHN